MMVDTNVVIDVREEDSHWFGWSSRAIASAGSPISVSAITVGELATGGGIESEILAMLSRFNITIASFDGRAGYRAGLAQRAYRRAGGTREKLLADFLIGAHAVIARQPLITRDPRHYRIYFPELTLITPETDA